MHEQTHRFVQGTKGDLKKHYTIILVTHALKQAMRLADHVVFMYYGEIVEQGKPEKLFKNPQTEKLRKYMLDGN